MMKEPLLGQEHNKKKIIVLTDPAQLKTKSSNWGSFWCAVFLVSCALILLMYFIFGSEYGVETITSFAPLIMTDLGIISGFEYYYVSESNVSTLLYGFRGIPYASPPVGSLRWKPPQKLQPWNGVLDAKTLGSPCVQAGPDGNIQGSEDCLYLNVYSTCNPSVNYDRSSLSNPNPAPVLYPVLFFIHGGGMMMGSPNATYDSLIASFANSTEDAENEGLVVVEIAYRLNAFGFLANKELSIESNRTSDGVYTSGNYGLLDQIAALEWTQNNIKMFGGDPSRVTIAGQSSGGTSVFGLISASRNKTRGLFNAGISMSGSPNITMSLTSAELQNAHFSSGCGGNSTQIVSCMRSWSSEEVYNRVPNSWNCPGIWNLPTSQTGQHYSGLLIVDGSTIPVSFVQALASGQGSDIPLLIGNMAFEADEGPEMNVNNYTLSQWRALLNGTFGEWSYNVSSFNGNESSVGSTVFGLSIASEMNSMYQKDANVNVQKAFDALVSDYGLFCAQIQLAKKAKSLWYRINDHNSTSMGSYNSSIFIYEDNWALSDSYISPWAGNLVQFAFHDTAYFMVTGQWNLIGANDDGSNGTYVPSEQDLHGSRLLQGIWRDFLRNSSLEEIIVYQDSMPIVWKPVNQPVSAGFNFKPPTLIESNASSSSPVGPDCYGNYSIFVIRSNSSKPSALTLDHKRDICTYFNHIGLDRPNYWWVN